MAAIKDFVRGAGPEVLPGAGYLRGDSWAQTAGPHTDCEGKIKVLGAGWGQDSKKRWGDGVLCRCEGCFLSYVIR